MVCSEKFAVGRFQTFKGTEQQPELEVTEEARRGRVEGVVISVSSAVSALRMLIFLNDLDTTSSIF